MLRLRKNFKELDGNDLDYGCDGGCGCGCCFGGAWQWNVIVLSKLNGIINFRFKPHSWPKPPSKRLSVSEKTDTLRPSTSRLLHCFNSSAPHLQYTILRPLSAFPSHFKVLPGLKGIEFTLLFLLFVLSWVPSQVACLPSHLPLFRIMGHGVWTQR